MAPLIGALKRLNHRPDFKVFSAREWCTTNLFKKPFWNYRSFKAQATVKTLEDRSNSTGEAGKKVSYAMLCSKFFKACIIGSRSTYQNDAGGGFTCHENLWRFSQMVNIYAWLVVVRLDASLLRGRGTNSESRLCLLRRRQLGIYFGVTRFR